MTAGLLALGCLAVLLATFLGGVVGFAYGLVALPLLLASGMDLSDVVVVNLAVGLTTRLVVVARRHADVNRTRAGLLVLGTLPGVALGVLARDRVSTGMIQLAAGLVALVAVALLSRRPSAEVPGPSRSVTAMTAGTLGGFLGATTSLNGVPPAVLLTGGGASARTMVADLAVYFVFGNLLTLGALVQSGHAPASWTWAAMAVWIPIGMVGNYLGTELGPRLPYAFFRAATLVVIAVSALASVVQALEGLR